jgi:hypothetical protein
MIATLRRADAAAGSRQDIRFQMVAGTDGLVRRVSLTVWPVRGPLPGFAGPTTWSVIYSALGSTPPIEIPTRVTDAVAR